MKILLIEDDPVQSDTLAKLLLEAGCKGGKEMAIEIAGNLAEGIAMSHQLHPDVCYLDLCLPDAAMDEVIGAINKIYPPVIVVSGMDDPNQDLKLKCFAHGAQNYFQKQKDMRLLIPHLISTGAAAHLRREAPKMLVGDGHQ